jgi:hypothetical protein
MTIGQFQEAGIQDPGQWYSLPTAEITYTFPFPNLDVSAMLFITAYHTTGTATPVVTVVLRNSGGTTLTTRTTLDYDTGSSNNTSQLIVEVPEGSFDMRLTSNIPAFVNVRSIKIK